MKKAVVNKLDISAAMGNLAILSAVIVASLPLLLGDQLVVVAQKVANEGASLIQDLANSILGFFS